jgi:hypothetical protein
VSLRQGSPVLTGHADGAVTGLPDFLIIGAPKSGTTSLYRYLETHPDIYMSPVKEPRYMAFPDRDPGFRGVAGRRFNREVIWRYEEYRALFAGRGAERMAGEASATYLWAPAAPSTIRRVVPGAKLIAILRDPVTRAHSHFCHNRRLGREPRDTFGEALDAEADRIAGGWNPNVHYRSRGLYGEQIARYLELFPREQLLVLLYDDLRTRPAWTLSEVCRFLGIDESFTFDTSARHNVTEGIPRRVWLARLFAADYRLKRAGRALIPGSVRSLLYHRLYRTNLDPRPPLDPELRRSLREYFRDDIVRLESLIRRDLGAWMSD